MVTREQLISEIQNIPERRLEEVYQILKTFESDESEPEDNPEPESVMAQLRQIKISAGPDFSVKAGLYDAEKR